MVGGQVGLHVLGLRVVGGRVGLLVVGLRVVGNLWIPCWLLLVYVMLGSCLALALLVEMMDQDWILALVVDMGMMKKLTLLVEMMEMS